MEQESLLGIESNIKESGPVECLGIKFENDDNRRSHFIELLREKLKDPEFRAIEGFPIGTDEAILELSDPPYYTACPNPWLNEFVDLWESQKEKQDDEYHREPFAADVSEGKNDPIYSAHMYHTKVPHKAIMRYILHYTNPGDIVFDGFSGSGMTGLAAHLCSSEEAIRQLGYIVDSQGNVISTSDKGVEQAKFSRVGERKTILNDLSPIATLISSGYNSPLSIEKYREDATLILESIKSKLDWIYHTKHIDGQIGKINYTVWSEVYSCPQCSGEVVFWEQAVQREAMVVLSEFNCKHCGAELSKRNVEKIFEKSFNGLNQEFQSRQKLKPVLINYSVNGLNRRFEKIPDELDIETLDKVNEIKNNGYIPTNRIIGGKEIGRLKLISMDTIDQLMCPRANLVLGAFLAECENKPKLKLLITSAILNLSWMYRWRANGKGGTTSGTYYICATPQENNAFNQLETKLKSLLKGMKDNPRNVVSCGDSSCLRIKENSIDYIFLDPPFGANLMYSELSYLWESWLQLWTNNKTEAIENSTQGKGPDEYRHLMTKCFKEAYRILKPGRWITIEFSNTKALIWNSIQTAIKEVGFVIANVSALDKKHMSFKAVTTATAVKQDLVITAYKPVENRLNGIDIDSDTYIKDIWAFINSHLNYLPVSKFHGSELVKLPERDPRILYDQTISYYISRGANLPLSSKEFHLELDKRFKERDGMYFTDKQLVEYERARIKASAVQQISIFVDDEESAIEWLRYELSDKPKSYSQIHPLFLSQLSGWKKNELELELLTLLEQNFLKYEGSDDVPSQIHTYLSTNFKDMRGLDKNDPKLVAKAKDRWYVPDPNKSADLDKVRLRSLLKEFEIYKQEKKKIKQPRAEALRAGFHKAWEIKDFQSILDVAAKIPTIVLQEDEKLLMFYDNALTLTSTEYDEW
ncbi:DNA methylase [Psychrobacter sp. C 20.9]|uniref:DNA methyltransferase n=1 Tax=Psychrobacter sp. C 20.9 TaxID=1926477 RepID=UPI000946D3D2|nr:DNA methyltransferase [Psychrobacter sp. C 20.9]OLF35571.1 DNA methylase [Psychrobacter sp. C 20.9]